MMYSADFCKSEMIEHLVGTIFGFISIAAMVVLTIVALYFGSVYCVGFFTFAVIAVIMTSSAYGDYKRFSKCLDEHLKANEE